MLNTFNRLIGKLAGEGDNPRPMLTVEDRDSLYEDPVPSIVSYLPFTRYDPDVKVFRLEDEVSVAAGYEIISFDADGKSNAFFDSKRDAIVKALASINKRNDPNDDSDPWVVQAFTQSSEVSELKENVLNSISELAEGSEFTEHYIKDVLFKHLDQISASGGIFEDAGAHWRCKYNRTRVFIYRRTENEKWPKRGAYPEDELRSVTSSFEKQLSHNGIDFQRIGGQQLYEWLLPFFNPSSVKSAGSAENLIKRRPYPAEDEANGDLPLSFDLAVACFLGSPESFEDDNDGNGVFRFQGGFYKYVTLGSMSKRPHCGILTLAPDENKSAMYDCLPDDSMVAMSITLNNQGVVKENFRRLAEKKAGEGDDSRKGKQQASQALTNMNNGELAYQVNIGVYVRGESLEDLDHKVDAVVDTLALYDLSPVPVEDDLLSKNSFLTQLPMAWHPKKVKRKYTSHFYYAKHIANLFPIWGRGKGTGRPGILNYNRSGEPVTINPFSLKDRQKAAHGLLLGPTGSGKSASLTYLIEHWMALFRPRMFVIEAGNSFGLMGDHMASKDVSVNHVRMSTKSSSGGLSPFADIVKLLDNVSVDLNSCKTMRDLEKALSISVDSFETDDDSDISDILDEYDEYDDDGRNLIGEMEIAAMIMITGGKEEDMKTYTRADQNMIRSALYKTAQTIKTKLSNGKRTIAQGLPSDLSQTLYEFSQDKTISEKRRARAEEMQQAINLYTNQNSLEGKFFNTPGKPWVDADLTLVDLDHFAREGQGESLAVLMTGLLNRINDIAEANQHSGRPIIVIIDEAHVITKNALLGPYVAVIGKMWRKLNTWLWLATQNMKDFPDQSAKMLSMAEFWILLNLEQDEIEQVARFRDLSEDEVQLMLSTRKEPGKYVEGVILSDRLKTLFRNVPPSLSLSLAFTEGDEKKERGDLMEEHGCSELEAAYMVADKIYSKRSDYQNRVKR